MPQPHLGIPRRGGPEVRWGPAFSADKRGPRTTRHPRPGGRGVTPCIGGACGLLLVRDRRAHCLTCAPGRGCAVRRKAQNASRAAEIAAGETRRSGREPTAKLARQFHEKSRRAPFEKWMGRSENRAAPGRAGQPRREDLAPRDGGRGPGPGELSRGGGFDADDVAKFD